MRLHACTTNGAAAPAGAPSTPGPDAVHLDGSGCGGSTKTGIGFLVIGASLISTVTWCLPSTRGMYSTRYVPSSLSVVVTSLTTDSSGATICAVTFAPPHLICSPLALRVVTVKSAGMFTSAVFSPGPVAEHLSATGVISASRRSRSSSSLPSRFFISSS